MGWTRRSARLTLVAGVATLALLAACGDDGADEDDTGGDAVDLEDTTWTLQDGSLDVEVPDDVEVTASFADGRMSGSSGCNNYGTEYVEQDGDLELGPITSTQMACGDAAGEVEAAFVASLEQVTGFAFDGDDLQLTGDDGEVLLTFSPA